MPPFLWMHRGKGITMTTIKFGDRDLKIKYGYKATVQSGIIKKLMSMGDIGKDVEAVDKLLSFLPEMLLVGLQKYHADEFGYDPENKVQESEQMEKIYGLLDEYFDSEDGDMQVLFTNLQKELLDNGFLSKMAKQGSKAKQAKVQTEKLLNQEEN